MGAKPNSTRSSSRFKNESKPDITLAAYSGFFHLPHQKSPEQNFLAGVLGALGFRFRCPFHSFHFLLLGFFLLELGFERFDFSSMVAMIPSVLCY